MSTKLSEKSYLVSTQLGTMVTTISVVTEYDVEDIIRQRAISQARRVQFVNIAKSINVNALQAPRTLPSDFIGTTEELPS